MQLIIALVLLYSVFSAYVYAGNTTCKDGVKIVTNEMKNPEGLIGNWTYVYHWDDLNEFKWEFAIEDDDHELICPGLSIEALTPEYVQKKKAECGDSLPFSWADAKLKLDAPSMKMGEAILVMGEKENWMMMECKRMVRVELNKVNEEYVVMINPDMAHVSEMITRTIPNKEELKCVAHNVDVRNGRSGFSLCA